MELLLDASISLTLHIGRTVGMGIQVRRIILSAASTAAVAAAIFVASCTTSMESPSTMTPAATCDPGNGGITLSPGFCATVFADNLGHVRHAIVSDDGTLYVNIWSGRYYAGSPVPKDSFLVALKDGDKDGKAETITKFGVTGAQGAVGGSGIALYKNYVYAEANDQIVRYTIPAGQLTPAAGAVPEVIISGLPTTGDHNMHPFVIDKSGNLFMDSGSASNSCQPQNRKADIMGAVPCVELETRGGIWKYDANKLNQVFSPKERYASGLRNAEGLAFDSSGRFFATMHGRDQLIQNWGKLYPDVNHTVELPSEELMEIKAGAKYGWPECYYDGFQKKLVLAPEYGGDGGKAVGICAQMTAPVAAYPAHWAPNDLEFSTSKTFPTAYQDGAFITFHGSWNRSPGPQDGFNVAYQPMKNGKASGEYIVFADGFTGGNNAKPVYRPMAVAASPDGSLYITDDNKGRIWRVTYTGPMNASLAGAPKPMSSAMPAPATPATSTTAAMPAGVTAALIANGDTVYHGSSCIACHGPDAKGTAVGPDLTDATWLTGDGSIGAITKIVSEGVDEPKQFRSPMPALGGANLSDDDLKAVSAYVWSISHK